MKWKTVVGMWGIVIVVGLYTTFVLQTLWNWFAVPAFHAPEISYWTIYGLLMLAHLIIDKPTFENDERLKRLAIIVSACVPDEKKEELEEALKADDDDATFKLGTFIFGQVVGSSVAVVLGFVIHLFLV